MRIDSSGNVGIGTSSPLKRLHIANAGDVGLMLQTTNAVDDKEIWEITCAGNASNQAELIFRTRTNAGTGGIEAMRIDDQGRIGIGTGNPSSELHLAAANPVFQLTGTNAGNCVLQTDGADLTLNVDTGDAKSNSAIAFRVDNSERCRIDNDGNFMIGVTSSTAKFTLKEAANLTEANPHVQLIGSGYKLFVFLDSNAAHIGQNSNSRSLRFYSGATNTAGAQLSAGATSFTTYSDERLKKNIKDIGSVLDKIKDIRCVSYLRKDIDNFRETIGFVAQDFVDKFDQVLDSSKIRPDDKEESLGIKYTETIPILLKAIQELSDKVAALEAA